MFLSFFCVYLEHIKSSLDHSISVRYNFSRYICVLCSELYFVFVFSFALQLAFNIYNATHSCNYIIQLRGNFRPKFMNYSKIRIVGTFAFHHIHLNNNFGLRSTIYLLHLMSCSGALLYVMSEMK